ncbi:MAG: hemolysin D, partial [Planctomycetota bacterium]
MLIRVLLVYAIGNASIVASGQSMPIRISDAQLSLIDDVSLASPTGGILADNLVDEGDFVEAGGSLVQLDETVAAAEVGAAEAAMVAAEIEASSDVDARYAKRTLEVQSKELEQSLIANKAFARAVSATEVEKLRLSVDQAKLAIEQAQHEQRVAEAKSVQQEA